MALFVIIPTSPESQSLDQAVQAMFDKKCLQLPRGEWLVNFDGTSKQLSDDLNLSDGGLGVSVVIVNFTGYYGRASKNIWEWMAVNSPA